MNGRSVVLWILALIPAIILAQTLYFKFTAAPEAVYIFTQLGVDPAGRILLGIVELIAVVLLLLPRMSVYGGVLAILLMFGAIGAHLTKLGIIVQNDGGTLFILAIVTLASSLVLVWMRRTELLALFTRV